jgi:hypothetical protein
MECIADPAVLEKLDILIQHAEETNSLLKDLYVLGFGTVSITGSALLVYLILMPIYKYFWGRW